MKAGLRSGAGKAHVAADLRDAAVLHPMGPGMCQRDFLKFEHKIPLMIGKKYTTKKINMKR